MRNLSSRLPDREHDRRRALRGPRDGREPGRDGEGREPVAAVDHQASGHRGAVGEAAHVEPPRIDGQLLPERAHDGVDERDVVAHHAALDLGLLRRGQRRDLLVRAKRHDRRSQRSGRPLRGDLELAGLDHVVVVVVVAEAVREGRGEHSDEARRVRLFHPAGDVVDPLARPARAVEHEHHGHVRRAVHGLRDVQHHLAHHAVDHQMADEPSVGQRLGDGLAPGHARCHQQHGQAPVVLHLAPPSAL